MSGNQRILLPSRHRLLRQASKGSSQLIQSLQSDSAPLREPLRQLDFEVAAGKGPEEWGAIESRVKELVRNTAAQVAPDLCLPILVQTIGAAYYRKPPAKVFGRALKIATAALWEHLAKEPSGGSARPGARSLGSLLTLVRAAALLDLVQGVRSIATIVDDEIIEIADCGIRAGEACNDLLNEFQYAFVSSGRIMRLAKAGAELPAKRAAVIPGILRVLHGDSPGEITELGTGLLAQVAATVPAREARGFWLGLLARLCLLDSAAQVRRAAGLAGGDAVILEGYVLGLVKVDPGLKDDLEAALTACLWQPDWWTTYTAQHWAQMIVDRRAVGIDAGTNEFVTSEYMLFDSINWYLESSVCGYAPSPGQFLPERAFADLVSQPFEDMVSQVFRSRGFVAGRVTENGSWHTGDGVQALANHGAPPPGEIDVLAWNPRLGVFVLVECKVLALPFNDSRLRNLMKKIGPEDDSGFFTKLRAKHQWLEEVASSRGVRSTSVFSLLVLDRAFPGMRRWNDVPVVDCNALGDALSELFPQA